MYWYAVHEICPDLHPKPEPEGLQQLRISPVANLELIRAEDGVAEAESGPLADACPEQPVEGGHGPRAD